MLPQELIRAKRDGGALSDTQLRSLVDGITDGSVSDEQIAAFAMAVFFRGMSRRETVTLTTSMRDSGEVLGWDGATVPGPVLDKHSTGGVGDKVSLMLAPIVAACGGAVPMISGRGLGHTGGTLDKMDAIPGYDTAPDELRFRRVVYDVGCAIVGSTSRLVPADRRFYAVRDVTATVESVPLLTASILSKKLAEGLDGLVLDVKFGTGAFLEDLDTAKLLARELVEVATLAGCPTTALLTDMNEVLGRCVGNAIEVKEAIEYLTAGSPREPRQHEVVTRLAADLLVTGGLAPTPAAAMVNYGRVLADGAAAERFARMVSGLGGPRDVLERPSAHLRIAPTTVPVLASRPGFVQRVNARRIGIAIVALGGGRAQGKQAVDHGVGLSGVAAIGAEVQEGSPLGFVHANDDASGAQAAEEFAASVVVGDDPGQRPVVAERITAA